MTPRKKRTRYIQSAKQVAEKHGIELDPTNWEQVWDLLDKFGEPSYVYAIVDKNNSLVKFGRSKSPGARLKAIKTGNGHEVSIWGYCEESSELNEKAIHQAMAEHRIGGEWFRLNAQTQAVINLMRAVALS